MNTTREVQTSNCLKVVHKWYGTLHSASKAPGPFLTICSRTHIHCRLTHSLEGIVGKELGAPYTCQCIPETGQIVLTPEKKITSCGDSVFHFLHPLSKNCPFPSTQRKKRACPVAHAASTVVTLLGSTTS